MSGQINRKFELNVIGLPDEVKENDILQALSASIKKVNSSFIARTMIPSHIRDTICNMTIIAVKETTKI